MAKKKPARDRQSKHEAESEERTMTGQEIAHQKDREAISKLSRQEKDQLIAFMEQEQNYRPVKFVKNSKGEFVTDDGFHGGFGGWMAALARATGTLNRPLSYSLLNQVAGAGGKECSIEKINVICAAMDGIAPSDEIESMLAAQMVATHNLAMEMMRAAVRGEWIDNIDKCTNMATKLLRTFTAQIEALKRYRSVGEQKVVVEHVHVHQGGRAIVGAIQTRGEGVTDEKQGSTPCKRFLEQETGTILELQKREAVRCENATEDALPDARHAEREM